MEILLRFPLASVQNLVLHVGPAEKMLGLGVLFGLLPVEYRHTSKGSVCSTNESRKVLSVRSKFLYKSNTLEVLPSGGQDQDLVLKP